MIWLYCPVCKKNRLAHYLRDDWSKNGWLRVSSLTPLRAKVLVNLKHEESYYYICPSCSVKNEVVGMSKCPKCQRETLVKGMAFCPHCYRREFDILVDGGE